MQPSSRHAAEHPGPSSAELQHFLLRAGDSRRSSTFYETAIALVRILPTPPGALLVPSYRTAPGDRPVSTVPVIYEHTLIWTFICATFRLLQPL
jgi:hypothetical protein